MNFGGGNSSLAHITNMISTAPGIFRRYERPIP